MVKYPGWQSTGWTLSLGSMKGHLTDLNKRLNVQLMEQKGDDDETEESFNEARKKSRKPSQAPVSRVHSDPPTGYREHV